MLSFRSLRWLSRRGVSRRNLRGTLVHRWLGQRLFARELWRFQRDAVARGWLIGSIVGATPLVGLQLVLGVPLALWFRANLFITLLLIVATNPATVVVYYPFAFMVGCRLLGRAPADYHWDNGPFWHAGFPLLLGGVAVGVAVGVLGYGLIRLLGRSRKQNGPSVPA